GCARRCAGDREDVYAASWRNCKRRSRAGVGEQQPIYQSEAVFCHEGSRCRTEVLSWSYCPVVIGRSDNISHGVNVTSVGARRWGRASGEHLSLVQNPVLRSDKQTRGYVEVVNGDQSRVAALPCVRLLGT